MCRRTTLILLLACLTLAQAGCYRRTVRDGWEGMRQFADETNPGAARSRDGQRAPDGYAIHIASFEGLDRQQRATRFVDRVVREARMPGLWIKAVGDRAVVYRGKYRDADHPNATDDLQQTRLTMLGGQYLFAAAAIVPLTEGVEAVSGKHDLRRHSGMYSLQIGYFDELHGPSFRKAAEQAVDRFREQGEDAFYYHGPNISMITVGLFTVEDVQQQVTKKADGTELIQPIYSDRVLDVQQRYPFNVANGQVPDPVFGPGRPAERSPPQPSFLVRVP